MDSGYIKTLSTYGQWLYQDIVYAYAVVISRHCLCIDSGYIKTFFMYGQWLYQDIDYAWTVIISLSIHKQCLDIITVYAQTMS
jgi:hypothetical protein